MSWIVAIYIPGAYRVLGMRWNGEFSYYATNWGVEVFARRKDAEWVAQNEFSIIAQDWIKTIVRTDAAASTPFSIGVAVCKKAQRIAGVTGYFPAKREIPELIEQVCEREDVRAIRRKRRVTGGTLTITE
jgi:NAD(P)-dependent dehydrogenase (short-subunit alcohol dehydrogenase family)